MDIRMKYDIGCQLYVVISDNAGRVSVVLFTIVNASLEQSAGTKFEVIYRCRGACGLWQWDSREIKESDINKDGVVYDNRQNAYNRACKLIDENIQQQINDIAKTERV